MSWISDKTEKFRQMPNTYFVLHITSRFLFGVGLGVLLATWLPIRTGIIMKKEFLLSRIGRLSKMVNPSAQTNDISGLYQALVQHKIHQDQLLWSRIQIVNAIQVGVLAGGFALHSGGHSFWGGWLLVIGGLLTLVLYFLIIGDYADMKVNEKIMKRLAEKLLPPDIGGEVRWTGKRCLPKWLPGHYMIYCMVILFISADFILGICLLCRPSIFG